MTAHHRRKLLLAAMLATAVSASALANDAATTAQQTAVGQGTAEMAPAQDDPVVVKESYATATNGPAAARPTRARQGSRAAPASSARQPTGGDYYSGGPVAR